MAGGSLITDLDLLEWYTTRFSLHYRGDSHKERTSEKADYYDAFSYTGSVGMENEFGPTEGLTCILGASYDWFEVTKSDFLNDDGDEIDKPDTMDEFNPMVGLSYEFKDTTKIYGSIARKTRFPTLQYLYSGKSYNPDLEAEHSVNYTIGISRSLFDWLDASVEGFYSDISNWISRDYNEDGLDGWAISK
jgi:iron complex outermembrane receptor protein